MIYFARCETTRRFKIGHTTKTPGERVSSLQTGSAPALEVLATMPGDEGVEAALHDRFEAYHVRGEWFKPGPLLVRYVVTLMPGGDDLLPFAFLAGLQPALWEVAEACAAAEPGPHFCANEFWFGGDPAASWDGRFEAAVGPDYAGPFPLVATHAARGAAFDFLYDRLLPACGGTGCGCLPPVPVLLESIFGVT